MSIGQGRALLQEVITNTNGQHAYKHVQHYQPCIQNGNCTSQPHLLVHLITKRQTVMNVPEDVEGCEFLYMLLRKMENSISALENVLVVSPKVKGRFSIDDLGILANIPEQRRYIFTYLPRCKYIR